MPPFEAGKKGWDNTKDGAGPMVRGICIAEIVEAKVKEPKPDGKVRQVEVTVKVVEPAARKGETFRFWESTDLGPAPDMAKTPNMVETKAITLYASAGLAKLDENGALTAKSAESMQKVHGMTGDAPMGTFFAARASKLAATEEPLKLHLYTIPGEGDLDSHVSVLNPNQYQAGKEGKMEFGDLRQKKRRGAGGAGGGAARGGGRGTQAAVGDDADMFRD